MSTETPPTSDNAEIYRQLEEYPWDSDKDFQTGLTAILGPNPSPSQLHDLTLRAQCFYLSRMKSTIIDIDGYIAYLSTKAEPTSITPSSNLHPSFPALDSSSSSPFTMANSSSFNPAAPAAVHSSQVNQNAPNQPPYPPTFAQIVELITSGKPIPGIKDIPDEVYTGPVAPPTLPKRRKPWEKDVPEEIIQGKGEGTFGDHRDHYIPQELPDA